jgi:polysaccharide biosynthesis transport protein
MGILGGLVLASIYLVFAHQTYTSTAEVYIIEGSGQQAPGDDYLNTQCRLMTSTPVLALAVSQDGIKDLETLSGVSDPIDYLRQNVNAAVAEHSQLIDVSLEARDKFDAARIVNAVVQSYLTYQTRIQHSTSAGLLDVLDKEKSHDEDVIAVKNQELTSLRAMYGEPAYSNAQDNPVVQQESALSNALTTARLETMDAQSAYDQALALVGDNSELLARIEAPGSPADQAAASPEQLPQIRAQIVEYQQTVEEMERTYLPDHPRVQLARSRLAELTVMYVRAQRQRWLSAQAQEQSVQASFDRQHRAVQEQATRGADFDRVRGELAEAEKDLGVIDGRISQVSMNQDAGSLTIEVTRAAVPALYPTHPQKIWTLAGWMLAGLVVGCGLAVGLGKMTLDPRAMSGLSTEFGAPVVGVFPSMIGTLSMAERALQSHFDPDGAVADISRSVARIITESGIDEVGGRTLLMASMNAGEGKTTLAVNMGIAMARSGMKVLLVDGNSRSPRLHEVFNLNNDFGLFDILQGKNTDHRATHQTMVENLDVLTTGVVPGNTVELLNTERLVDVLGEFSDQYDRVIVDSPAMGRGVEARILAANCSTAILVTAARPTVRRQVGFGLGMLRSVGAKVLGLVINEPSPVESRKPAKMESPSIHDPLGEEDSDTFRSAWASGTED